MRLDPTIIRAQIANLKHVCLDLEDDEKLLEDMIEGETDTHEFLRQLADWWLDDDALVGALTGRIMEMMMRKDRIVERSKTRRKLALAIMQAAGIKKCELPECTLSVRAGSQSVSIEDDTAVPDDFASVKTLRVPDRARIKEALKDGAAFNWAQLVTGAPSLSVRTK